MSDLVGLSFFPEIFSTMSVSIAPPPLANTNVLGDCVHDGDETPMSHDESHPPPLSRTGPKPGTASWGWGLSQSRRSAARGVRRTCEERFLNAKTNFAA